MLFMINDSNLFERICKAYFYKKNRVVWSIIFLKIIKCNLWLIISIDSQDINMLVSLIQKRKTKFQLLAIFPTIKLNDV